MASVVQFNASTEAFVQALPGYSRPLANLTPAQRLDYSANIPTNCPAALVGLGEAPFVPQYPTLTARQKYGAVPEASTGSLVSGEWRVTVPAVTMTLEERKAKMKAEATERFKQERDAGTTVTISSTDYDIASHHDAIVELREGLAIIKSTDPAGTIKIVTRAGDPITMTQAICEAMISAIHSHVKDCQERENALYTAINAAADHDDLDAIDVTTGWPS